MIIDLIQQAQAQSGMTKQELSEAIGKKPGYISDLFRNRRDPGASVFLEICRVLSISADHAGGLMPKMSMVSRGGSDSDRIAAQLMSEVMAISLHQMAAIGKRPSVDDIVSWWRREAGVLSDFDHIAPMCDLYEVPAASDSATVPAKIGANSLAAESFSVSTVEELRSIIRKLPIDFRSNLVGSYSRAKDSPLMSLERIDYDAQAGPAFGFHYTRVLLPVTSQKGQRFILNYSKIVA